MEIKKFPTNNYCSHCDVSGTEIRISGFGIYPIKDKFGSPVDSDSGDVSIDICEDCAKKFGIKPQED